LGKLGFERLNDVFEVGVYDLGGVGECMRQGR
jgi:hypothetical protein